MKLLKNTALAFVAILGSMNAFAQVLSNDPVVSGTINGENPFFDGSTNFDPASSFSNTIGKGLLFPRTDLTSWEFSSLILDGTVFPTAYDGMIVYNTGTGNTLTSGNNPNTSFPVAPGFYYFYNPDGAVNLDVSTGEWIPLTGGGAAKFIDGADPMDAVYLSGSVGVGTTTPESSAALEVNSSTQGFLPSRMSTAQINNISSPATGLMIYNTTVFCLQVNDGTPASPIWNCISGLNITLDTDGDGEPDVIDSNPNDPCLPAQAAGYTGYDAANATWLAADCDGDGITNGDEVTCGSDPYDATSLCPPPSVPNNCNPSNPTAIVDVTNAHTGKTWMDRNLGANRAATSSTDAESYGSLYQWGRGSDGHQCVNRYAGDGVTTSSNTALNATVSTDTPPHGDFILINTGNNDWRSPQNNNLWQGVNGTNNPCPTGYRIPTEAEFDNERLSWVQAPISSTNNAAGAFASPLKLPMAGYRTRVTGSLLLVGSGGLYWSSSVSSIYARYLLFSSSAAEVSNGTRAGGFSVRCIKD
jgi:uncharacterized protein (TIGR02145 family)